MAARERYRPGRRGGRARSEEGWPRRRVLRPRRLRDALRNPVALRVAFGQQHTKDQLQTLYVNANQYHSEALAMELPMIIYHPIPGQEYANRDYLMRAGTAMAADNSRELGRALDRVCQNPGILDEMRASISKIRRPDAAQDAGIEILRLRNERWRWSGT